MVSIDEVKQIVFAMCQKQRHSAVSPDEFSRLAQLANLDEYAKYVGSINTYYQLGKAMPRLSPGMSKLIDRKLTPFIVSEQVIAKVNNVFPLPATIEFLDTVIAGSKQADWKPYNMIQSYLDSTIDTPTVEYPIFTDYQGGLRVYPDSIASIKLTYLKAPNAVEWAYTLANGRTPTYDSTNSVNFEWGASHKLSLITKILGYMGLSIRDGELKQMALQEEQKAN